MSAFFQNNNAGINKTLHLSENEQKVRKFVYERYNTMRFDPHRLEAEKEWEYGEKTWDALRKERDEFDWQSTYHIPLTTSVIESILAEFVDQRLRPLILPRGEEDVPKAEIMSHMFDYTWDVGDGDVELYYVLKSALIRGTAFAQEYYLKDRRMVYDIQGLNNLSKKQTGKNTWNFKSEPREVFEFDDCKMEYLSNWEIFWDEKARDFNRGTYKAKDAIRRFIMHIDDFKAFFSGPIWDPMGYAQYVKPGGDTNYYQFYQPPQGIDHSQDVEVLWYWGRRPEDALWIVANDVPVRIGPNIFRHKQLPFARAVDVHRLDRFCGKGEPKLLESVQEELNTLRRMTIDRHHLDLDKSFLVSRTAQLNDEDLVTSQPHNIIEVDDPKSVVALEYGDIPNSVQMTTRSINEDAVRVTGVDDRAQSLQKAPSTATEAAILKEATLKRIKMKIMLFTKGFMTDISRQRVANIMQFYSTPQVERILGEKNSQEYHQQLMAAARDNTLEVRDDVPYKQTYRQIRTQGKQVGFDERGRMIQRDTPGFGFFEAKPEYFMPAASGGFDIRFEAGSTMPVSKPLMQSKATEMFDRLIQLTADPGSKYSAEKLADMLVKVNDYNPQDLKVSENTGEADVQDNRLQLSIELANRENEEVLGGRPITQNGTPFAPPAHTELHVAFLQSPQMKQAPEQIYRTLVKHAMGEMMAQQVRQGQSPDAVATQFQGMMGGQGSAAPNNPAPPNNQQAQILPDRIQGGAQVPTGMPLGPAR